MAKKQPVISVITVGMNHLRFIRDLYISLYRNEASRPKIQFEAIYVDNCSNDGSADFVANEFPEVKVIVNREPLGFGENNNIGVKNSSGKYIAIINPDIILLSGSLEHLFTFMEENSKIGIIAPQLLNCDRSIQFSARRFITLKLLFWRFITYANDNAKNKAVNYYLCKNFDFNVIHAVDWAFGAALFISRDFYNQLNGFDEDYFLYFEDEDICLRSWREGGAVIYLPESKMIHNHLRDSVKIGSRTLCHLKSLLIFFRKHGLFIRRKNIISYLKAEIEMPVEDE